MRRPVLESGEARVIVYASRAGENVTAMQLILACEDRERHMKRVLQNQGKMVLRTDRVATPQGDIEIIAKWQVLGAKQSKAVRRARRQALTELTQMSQTFENENMRKRAMIPLDNDGSSSPGQVSRRDQAPESLQASQGEPTGQSNT